MKPRSLKIALALITAALFIAGAVYAVGIDDTIMVKRLEKRPGKLVLLSDNPQHAPIFLDAGDMCFVFRSVYFFGFC